MIDFSYLYKGICGLAHAHCTGTLSGHLGAAVAAGYFYGEDQPDLPREVYQGVEAELDRIIAGEEAIWFNTKQKGILPRDLFEPFPEAKANEQQIGTLADALQKNIGQTRQSGHNVIFASIALRALRDHPQYATSLIVQGLRRLIEGFNNAHPGRGYFGKTIGWKTGHQVELTAATDFPPYRSIEEMVRITIQELITTAPIRKQGFGGLWHLINHAAGLVELDRFGYGEVARKGLPAHHQHLRLWRELPPVEQELGPVVKSDRDPRDPLYWEGMLKRDDARLTHRIKTLYGFSVLRRFLETPETIRQADEALLYLMA